MAQMTYCDVCGRLIKKEDIKFLLGLQQVRESNSKPYRDRLQKEMQEYLVKWYEEQYSGVLVYEICVECKEILYQLFKMKKKEREKILKSLEDIYKQEPKKKKGWGQK